MGGVIRVILIKDNLIHKQTRWTNTFPEFVEHDKFIEKNSDWWDHYINCKSDYSSDKDDFSPEEYGLLVLDYDNKRVYDCQGYSSLRTIYKTGVSLYMMHNVIGPDYDDEDDIIDSFEKIMERWEKNFKKNFEKNKSLYHNNKEPNYFYVDWEKFGWKFKKFEDNLEGYKEYFKIISEKYSLSDSEKEHWNDWLKRI